MLVYPRGPMYKNDAPERRYQAPIQEGAWLESQAPLYILTLSLLILGMIYALYAQTVADGSDTVGYVYAGEQLAQGRLPMYCNDYNELVGPYFMYYTFSAKPNKPGPCRFYNQSLGFPLLLAFTKLAASHSQAIYYFVPLIAILGLIGIFYLSILLFGNLWVSLWSTLLLAITPTYLYFATSPWSDVPGAVAIIWGIALYLTCRHGLPSAKRSILAMLSASLFGFSAWIRPTNIVIALPFALYVVWSEKGHVLHDIRYYLFVGTLFIFGMSILVFNHFYYGNYLITGSSPEHNAYPVPLFRLQYAFGPSLSGGYSALGIINALWANYSGFLLLAPLALAYIPLPKAVLIAGTAVSVSLVHAFYAFAPIGINARFLILPLGMIGLLLGSGMFLLVRKVRDRSRLYRSLLVAITILVLVPIGFRLEPLAARNKAILDKVNLVLELTHDSEENAVFLSYIYNDLIMYYGQKTVLNYRRIPTPDTILGRYRWEEMEPSLVASVDRLLSQNVPVYYVRDLPVPLANSLEILAKYYNLSLYRSAPETYRIESKRY